MAKQWIVDLNKEVQLPDAQPEQEPCTKSIYRVPKILTDVNSQAYKPKLASFGPYHHDCIDLRPMEQHKHRALIQFLRRIAKSSKTSEDVLIAMRKEETRLLASYDGLQINEDDDGVKRGRFPRECLQKRNEFLKLMIVDGCFALEVMLAEKRYFAGEKSEYDSRDPIFGVERRGFNSPDLKRDMLLLENQIPLLALTTLAAIDGSGIEDVRALINSFYNFFGKNYSPNRFRDQPEHVTRHMCLPSRRRPVHFRFYRTLQRKSPTSGSVHILDLYRRVITAEGEYLPSFEENVQSATTLRNAGVSFCKSNTKSFGNISFNGGVLSLPPLDIDSSTESLLVNLMAFERLHATAGNKMTAYAYFMDGLINTADDVALLRKEKIITESGNSDENIAAMFEKITTGAELVTTKGLEVDVNKDLNEYCKKRMHRWRASFVKTYLSNPWVFFSLLGGLFLLAVTVLQTLYSMLQYYDA